MFQSFLLSEAASFQIGHVVSKFCVAWERPGRASFLRMGAIREFPCGTPSSDDRGMNRS